MTSAADPYGRQFDANTPVRAPSAARLAAEAFFAPRTEPAPVGPTPEVFVRKSELEEPGLAMAVDPTGTRERSRESRVFRLPVPLALAEMTDVEAHFPQARAESKPDLPVSSAESDPLPVHRAMRRRKQRRELHGEVTITRPPRLGGVADSDATSSLQSSLTAERATASEAFSAEFSSVGWPRYLAMRRQLLALQSQAQEAKMHEAQAALVWIHQAIADYNITPRDLGFGN